MMGSLLRSARYAVRALARTPGFTLTAILTLALCIGASGAMMSVLDHVLLRALPFPDAGRLVRVQQVQEQATAIAPVRLQEWSRLGSTFESLSGYFVEDVSDTTAPFAERLRRAAVASGFLETLEVAPAMGRGLEARDFLPGAAPVVLLSHRHWRERMAGRADVLGSTLRIDDTPHAVVGVMPPSFQFPEPDVAIWSPGIAQGPNALDRDLQWYVGVARLKPDVTLESALADLAVVQAGLARQYPATDAAIGAHVEPLATSMLRSTRGSLWLLFGAVCALLAIACTNVAALLLTRFAEREPQLAVRHALGASRASMAMQVMTETMVLVLAAAMLGTLVAIGACAAIRWLAPDLPRVAQIGVDLRMLGFTFMIAMVVAMACGVLPAVRSARVTGTLSGSGRTQLSPSHSLQWLLVGFQVALSVALMAGAGLLLRSFDQLSRVAPGFDSEGVLVLRMSGNWSEEEDRPRLASRIEDTLEALASLPGVQAVATAWQLPGIPTKYAVDFELATGRAAGEPALHAEWRTVSPGYFDVTRIPLVAGARCELSRPGPGTKQLMVNAAFAQRYFPGRSAIGHSLAWEAGANTGRIAGVVGDAREGGMERAPPPTVYACDSAPTPFPWFLVRTRGEPEAAITAVRNRLQQVEPLRSAHGIVPLTQRISGAYSQDRLRASLVALFAVTALALSCLGIYATLGYVVSLRRREIGLRMALGAQASATTRQFVGKALRVAAFSCAAGVVLAAGGARLMSGMLHGISPWDPLTFAGVIATVLAVAALAALRPALRASRIDPMRALREG